MIPKIREQFNANFTPEKYEAFKAGLAKMYNLFGEQMDNIISEMNEALVA